MKQIVVVGAGRIGATIADLLSQSGAYAVTVVDRSAEALAALDAGPSVRTEQCEVSAPGALEAILTGKFAVLSAAPYSLTTRIAGAAATAGVHYLDLTEDVKSTRQVRKIAETARTAFIPQCGLAPGFIAIAAMSLAKQFDTLEDVRMRVGALPQFPTTVLNYALTWSPEGVINEYCEPCEAIVDGKLTEVPPLDDIEEFTLDGIDFEAFNTSGGLGSTPHKLLGKVRNLNYRTIRYPGHARIMKLLLNDLNLKDRRDLALDIFRHALTTTRQDMVVILVEVTGMKDGHPATERFARTILSGRVGDKERSAIQITTASGIATVLDMLASGDLPQQGFVAQDEIDLDAFLANRFGKAFAQHQAMTKVA
ncbi:MAG TPA: saccharopine dehydrogenase C-terminal domain-containing protein [Pelagibacterium sp.]|uniref:saccharopine dehydrogenase family protein n=1 Tax=Pelagibacterium sp. TaxID=1967288 RepID=UPI002B85BFAD|nr:saccharopine dehydrogenase C-terminal domain-containing protein [Pelagibacterium sp.]HWJ88811.1 saccharopine dehydrogenase C-terminal domain-containing protein [Pelagibacterium sp.]